MDISSIDSCSAADLKELMGHCGPFVKVRDDADYWIFQRFFKSTSFVAHDGVHLVGAITAWIDPENIREIYIEEVAVHPAHRGKGIALSLFEKLEEEARRRACVRLWLTCNPSNPAIQVWVKLGFSNVESGSLKNGLSVIQNLKGHGLHRAIFEKAL